MLKWNNHKTNNQLPTQTKTQIPTIKNKTKQNNQIQRQILPPQHARFKTMKISRYVQGM